MSSGESLRKEKTMEGLNYRLNQEKHLRVFLQDGNVPIDNSAAESAIRPFCIGKKKWVLINSEKGAEASAIMYSIAESAKLNNLKPYMYFKHLLSVLPEYIDKDGWKYRSFGTGYVDAVVENTAEGMLQAPLKSGVLVRSGGWFNVQTD